MKEFFIKHRERILILIPIVIAVLTICAGSLEKRVSEIYTSYTIDVATLNNSFITLAVDSSNQNKEAVQKVKEDLSHQMEKFNAKYDDVGNELRWKEPLGSILNSFILILLLLQMIFVVATPQKN